MSDGVRRGFTQAIPWLAVVCVAVFAFAQLRARNAAQSDAVKARDDLRAHQTLAQARATERTAPSHPAPQPAEPSERERALDALLTRAQEQERALTSRITSLEQALEEARAGADRLHAANAAASARADALQARTAEALTEARRLIATGQQLVETEPVKRWVADADSGEAARVAYARACAKTATPEQVEALRILLTEDPPPLTAVARLAGDLPDGAASTGLLVDLLGASPADEVAALITTVGTPRLLQLPVLEPALDAAPEGVRQALLERVPRRKAKWSPKERPALAALLRSHLTGSGNASAVAAARALALLELAGAVPDLLAAAKHEQADIRAAAVHALSRVPDARSHAPLLHAALPRLWGDGSLSVRLATVLLIESLSGVPVDLDPAADEAARARAFADWKAARGN